MNNNSIQRALEMLKNALDGQTYVSISAKFGIPANTVEYNVKQVIILLLREIPIEGLTPETRHVMQRLRQYKTELKDAIAQYQEFVLEERTRRREVSLRALSDHDIQLAVSRVQAHSRNAPRDVALLWFILATGARPIEIAQLVVSDYLNEEGRHREESLFRGSITANRRARPLLFVNDHLIQSLDAYLMERPKLTESTAPYRGLPPQSPLFLKFHDVPFTITQFEARGRSRRFCREILETYRGIFRSVSLPSVSALSLRQTLVHRLYERGATDQQVGHILGITPRGIRQRFRRTLRPLPELLLDVV